MLDRLRGAFPPPAKRRRYLEWRPSVKESCAPSRLALRRVLWDLFPAAGVCFGRVVSVPRERPVRVYVEGVLHDLGDVDWDFHAHSFADAVVIIELPEFPTDRCVRFLLPVGFGLRVGIQGRSPMESGQ